MGIMVAPSDLLLSDRIFFDFGKRTIKPVTLPIVEEVVRILKSRPDIKKFSIQGHASAGEPDPKKLSEARARAVLALFIDQGIDRARMVVEAYGQDYPLVSNDTPDHRAINRRLDFEILDREGCPAPKRRYPSSEAQSPR